MTNYSVKVPLIVEFVSSYNKYDFKAGYKIEIDHNLNIFGCDLCVKSEKGNYTLFIENINEENEENLLKKVEKILYFVSRGLSILIQEQNEFQHYGHARINWEINKIEIDPRDSFVSDSVGMTVTFKPDTLELQNYLNKILSNEKLQFIIDCNYNSIAPLDIKSKFYNAFSIIEYIEENYKNDISTTPLINKCLYKEIENILKKVLIESKNVQFTDKKELNDYIARILNIFSSKFKNATFQTREEKLLLIINEKFKIFDVEITPRKFQVNKEFVKSIIKTRNNFFHAKKYSTEELKSFKDITDQLIVLNTKIINKLLNLEIKNGKSI